MINKLFTLLSFICILSSCTKSGNLIPSSSLNPLDPIKPGDPNNPPPGTGGKIENPAALFVATLDGNEAIFELKSSSIVKHTAIPHHGRLNSSVKINSKIYYSLESLHFDALGVSEVYELDIQSGQSQKISSFHSSSTRNVSSIFAAGTNLYASVKNESLGTELYLYENGTWKLLNDIETGSVGSYPAIAISNNQTAYFTSYKNSSGIELWTTDNNATLFVDSINGQGSSHVFPWFIKDGNIIATLKNPGTTSYDLYSIDSQKKVTKIVSAASSASSGANPLSVTPFKNGVVANCHHDSSGRELCVSDQLSGNWKVIDIYSGSKFSNPRYFVNYKDEMYFQAEGNLGIELYKTNGTTAELVKDIKSGSENSYPEGLMVIADKLYFSAYDEQGAGFFQFDGNAITKIKTGNQDLKFARSLLNASY